MPRRRGRAAIAGVVAALAGAVVAGTALGACGPSPSTRGYNAYTDHFAMVISPDHSPPVARQLTQYTVVVRDKNSGQPIQRGEGIIYGNTRDGARVWDTFVPGKALGTYHAKVDFVVSGQWAMGLRFRRDSTHTLEQVDWMQDIVAPASSTP